MAMTLEQIKGMNIPVGTPIEIKFSNAYKMIGYFHSLETKETTDDVLVYTLNTKESKNFDWRPSIDNKIEIPRIEEIKILEHKRYAFESPGK